MNANSGLPVLGARVNRPQYGHYFSDEGLVWGGISWVLLVAVDKKYLAHLLINQLQSNEDWCAKYLAIVRLP